MGMWDRSDRTDLISSGLNRVQVWYLRGARKWNTPWPLSITPYRSGANDTQGLAAGTGSRRR